MKKAKNYTKQYQDLVAPEVERARLRELQE